MKKFIKSFFIKKLKKYGIAGQNKQDKLKLMLGKQLCLLQNQATINQLNEADFSVFSQFGEDGMINYLTAKIPIKNRFFIEFGVANYDESNTRFLMMNKNWGGVVIDGDQKNMFYQNDNVTYYQSKNVTFAIML